MKKISTFMFSVALLVLGTLVLTSCDFGSNGGEPTPPEDVHTCEFTQQSITEEYLKESATCETKAKYYYSCTCGEKGSQTFEYGEALGHDYEGEYVWEEFECSLVLTCKNDKNHVINKPMTVTSEVTSNPTCTEDGALLYTATLEYEGQTYITTKSGTGDAKLGHDYEATYSWEEFECTLTLTCKTDSTHVVTEKMTVASEVKTPSTCTELGVKTYVATFEYEGKTYTDNKEGTIEKIPHTYVEKFCDVCGEREYSQGLEFELSEDETYYSVIGMGECTDTNLWIPKTHNDLPVKMIKQNAFANQTSIVEVIVPDSVITIEVAAFYGCNSIVKMELPFIGMNGVDPTVSNGQHLFGIIFGNSSFSGATETIQYYNEGTASKYRTFYIPNSLKTVVIYGGTLLGGEFYNCKYIEYVDIKSEITELPKSVFFSCEKLKGVSLPDTVSLIGEYSFGICKSLETFKVPAETTEIGPSAFVLCEKLASVEFNEKLVNIKGSAFNGCDLLDNVILPEGLTTLSNDAFEDCSSLKKIVLPSTLEIIGWRAFYMCSSLEEINIPSGVKEIMGEAFAFCSSLKEFIAPDGSTISYDILEGCTSLEKISLPYIEVKTEMQYGVEVEITFLGYYFGAENWAHHDSKIPASLKSIRIAGGKLYKDAFAELTVDEFILGTGVTHLNVQLYPTVSFTYEGDVEAWINIQNNSLEGTSAGVRCPKFYFTNANKEKYEPVDLVIADGVETIWAGAFSYISSLKNVTIPASVKTIKHAAFYSENIENVYYKGTIDQWAQIDMADITSNPMLFGKHFFMLDENNEWYEVTELVVSDQITEINYQYVGFDYVTNIVIPEGILTIGERAFYDNRSLEEIVIPSSVTSIGNDVFKKCISLKSITVPFIGDSMKNDQDSVIYPIGYFFGHIGNTDSDTELCNSSKKQDNSYTFYSIPKTLETVVVTGGNISPYAFYDTKIINIVIGDGVKYIHQNAFNKALKLESLTIPFVGYAKSSEDTANYFPLGWMFGTVANSGEVYGARQNIEYVNGGMSSEILYQLPKTLTKVTVTGGHISGYAFKNCNTLTEITLADGVTGMGVYSFQYCSSLEKIFFSNSITNVSDRSFFGCAAGKTLTLFFYGTRKEMYALIEDKEVINSATKYAYSEVNPYENPAEEDDIYYNFWHYDAEGNIVIWEK